MWIQFKDRTTWQPHNHVVETCTMWLGEGLKESTKRLLLSHSADKKYRINEILETNTILDVPVDHPVFHIPALLAQLGNQYEDVLTNHIHTKVPYFVLFLPITLANNQLITIINFVYVPMEIFVNIVFICSLTISFYFSLNNLIAYLSLNIILKFQ